MTNPWEQLQMEQEKPREIPETKSVISELNINENEFVASEAVLPPKLVITIYGLKGSGKTTLALGFPGTISVLSFDRKSTAPKTIYYNNDGRIKVYDAVKYYDRDVKVVRESAVKTYTWIVFLLKKIRENPPDWVVIDGIEIMQKVAEMVMRQRNNLLPYQGVANLNLWKERNAVIDEIHNLALQTAKKGVIYTTYCEYEEIIQEGTLIVKDHIPKYIDSVMWETDIVLRIENRFDMNSKKNCITVRCDTSKFDNLIKTGTLIDITGKKISDIIDFNKFFEGTLPGGKLS